MSAWIHPLVVTAPESPFSSLPLAVCTAPSTAGPLSWWQCDNAVVNDAGRRDGE